MIHLVLPFVMIFVIIYVSYWMYLKLITRKCTSTCDLRGKTIIVTGGASGIGFEISKGLAKRGAHIVLACRNIQKAMDAAGELERMTGNTYIKVMELDLASFDSVRHFAQQICEQEVSLHTIIHNAGLILFNYEETKDGLETVMQVNYFAPFLLTRLLMDRLAENSRVVFVSSLAHELFGKISEKLLRGKTLEISKSYGNSKLCQIYLCQFLAEKNSAKNVTFNALHPGTIYSSFYSTFPLRMIFETFFMLFGKSPMDGAQTALYVAMEPSLEGVTGQYFDNCAIGRKSKYADDRDMQRKVIEAAELVTGVCFD